MERGRIIKALSGFYYVENKNGIYQCRARGIFRKQKVSPFVGDWVDFEAENFKEGYIMDLKPRKNELIRPPIVNVDQAVLVFSIEEPKFNPVLLDRFLVHVEANQIKPVICLSKLDLKTEKADVSLASYEDVYRKLGYAVVKTSIYIDETLQLLKPYLNDKISVFAGQSGVGKSSLLNALKPGLEIETNDISKSLGRGKHTTRHVELIPLNEGGYVADTPGFSLLDFQGMEANNLSQYFPEMLEKINDCKFRACTHINEPSCSIKAAVTEGEIAPHRYDHYVQFFEEIKNHKRRY